MYIHTITHTYIYIYIYYRFIYPQVWFCRGALAHRPCSSSKMPAAWVRSNFGVVSNKQPGLSWFYHGFIMVLSWLYHGLIMALSWLYHGWIMVLSWLYHGFIMVLSWFYHGFIMVFIMVLSWFYHGFIMVLSWFLSWLYHGCIMAVSWFYQSNPFLLILNVPLILKTGIHLQFPKISVWPIWLLIDPL